MKVRRQSARFKTGLVRWVVLAWLGIAASAFCQSEPAQANWRVTMAAKFTLPQVSQPIPGSNTTVLVPACVESAGNVRAMTQDEFAALGVDWAAFLAKAGLGGSAELAKLKPEWVRDRHRVIECAILRAAQPGDDLTAVLFAPEFIPRFTPVFGRTLLVAIPDRHTIYLFPKLASRYPEYAQKVLAVYGKSKNPVTRELFELSVGGLRAVGTYEEP